MTEPPTITTPTSPPAPTPRTLGQMVEQAPSREVMVRPRTLLVVAGTALGIAVVVWVLLEAFQVISWMVIAIVLAIALMPAVDRLEGLGMPNSAAVATVCFAALAVVGLLAWALVPPLVTQSSELVEAVPDAVDDLTRGRGPLGFLQTEYGIADRAREYLETRTGGGVLGFTAPALGVVRGILTVVVATVTIFFLVVFLLREGRRWVESGLALVSPQARPRWERVLAGVTRTIRGYVTGNLLISVIAGLVSLVTLMALGVPYALPVSVLVAVLDLVPLVGATLGTVVAAGAALPQGVAPVVVVLAVFIVYQQLENHLVQPLVYGRTVQLSPLMVLVAVLIGGQIAGILGALMAIPVAGSIQVVLTELIDLRRERARARWGPEAGT
jgi:predicted PurR-regulated permease PerM